MPDLKVSRMDADEEGLVPEVEDEVDEVPNALRRLRDRVNGPVIRGCLDSARADIVHLVLPGGEGGERATA